MDPSAFRDVGEGEGEVFAVGVIAIFVLSFVLVIGFAGAVGYGIWHLCR